MAATEDLKSSDRKVVWVRLPPRAPKYMEYFYLFFPLAVWLISQTIKFIIRVSKKDAPIHLKTALWVYVWAAGAPSTHTAILISTLLLVWHEFGFSSIFTLALIVSALWIYDMISANKKQLVFNKYLSLDKSGTFNQIVEEGYMLDLSGHNVYDIIWGALLGCALGLVTINFIL